MAGNDTRAKTAMEAMKAVRKHSDHEVFMPLALLVALVAVGGIFILWTNILTAMLLAAAGLGFSVAFQALMGYIEINLIHKARIASLD